MKSGGTKAMTTTERVLAALEFRRPDRIPRYEILRGDFVKEWRKEKSLPEEANVYDYYDKIDIGSVYRPCGFEGPFPSRKRVEKVDGDYTYERNDWGRLLKKKKDAAWFEEIEVALPDKAMLDSVAFEPPELEERFAEVDAVLPYTKKRFAPVCGILGLYMASYYLRGQVQYFYDVVEDMSFCRALAGRVMEYTRDLAVAALDRSATWGTALWVHDEFCDKNGPMISPEAIEKIFLPAYKEMIGFLKSRGLKHVILHCDGNSLSLFDVLIEAGFTGVQSMAPTAGMWLPDVKKKSGDRLALIGGMCNITTLPRGTRREIEYQAKAIIEAGRDGGVIIGTHSIDGDVPVENYDAYYAAVNRYGNYRNVSTRA